MQPPSHIVPALAGAEGEALTTPDAESDIVMDVAHALAVSWPLHSGPFFTCDGQLATLIAQVFVEEQADMPTGEADLPA